MRRPRVAPPPASVYAASPDTDFSGNITCYLPRCGTTPRALTDGTAGTFCPFSKHGVPAGGIYAGGTTPDPTIHGTVTSGCSNTMASGGGSYCLDSPQCFPRGKALRYRRLHHEEGLTTENARGVLNHDGFLYAAYVDSGDRVAPDHCADATCTGTGQRCRQAARCPCTTARHTRATSG